MRHSLNTTSPASSAVKMRNRQAGVTGANAMPGIDRQKRTRKTKAQELRQIRHPFGPGNARRRPLSPARKAAEQLGAQLAVNLLGGDAAIGIGARSGWVAPRVAGRQEELAFLQDARSRSRPRLP